MEERVGLFFIYILLFELVWDLREFVGVGLMELRVQIFGSHVLYLLAPMLPCHE